MNKLKKRIETALTHLMLAENEVNRLKLLKKPVEIDDDMRAILNEIKAVSDKISGV